jgi:DNA-binding SARP family transcriptional activator
LPDLQQNPQIMLLGGFNIVWGDKRLLAEDWTRRKAAAIVQRLALEKRIVKDQAIDFLWPDASLSSGSNNLYRTLYALRQTLDTAFGEDDSEKIFSFSDGVLVLNRDVQVDVDEFEGLAKDHSKMTIDTMEDAIQLYQGELLPDDPYADWIMPYRTHLHDLYRDLCFRLVDHYELQADFSRATHLLMPLLQHDLLDEVIHRHLIRLYALGGKRHDALRQYQQCVDVLDEELGVPPDPKTDAIYQQVLNGDLRAQTQTMPQVVLQQTWLAPPPLAIEDQQAIQILGRELELDTLRIQVEKTQQGQGSTVLLAGETGIGKTRLAYSVLETASELGMIPLYGAFFEQEGQFSYQPYIEAINRFLESNGRSLTENPLTNFKPINSNDPQQQNLAMFNAVAAFLTDIAQQTPIILLIDDLHAGDKNSLHLFHFLARQTRSAPIMLLATYRTDLLAPTTSPFGGLLNSLYRERLQTKINVLPLKQQAVADLLDGILGAQPATDFSQSILEITEGNPFFVEEIVQVLIEQQRLEQVNDLWQLKDGSSLEIPSGLSGLMLERIAQLGEDVLTTLESGAVAGREFDFHVLREVISLKGNQLLDALDMALSGHILEESEKGYRFRHGFIRHVLYDSQSQRRRTHLHFAVANAIESVYSNHHLGLVPHAESLAYHYLNSDMPPKALPYLMQSAQKASEFFAYEVASDYMLQALGLMDELGINEENMRWQIYENLGKLGLLLANSQDSIKYFESALSIPTSSQTWQPSPAQRVEVHSNVALCLLTTGDLDYAERHLQQAFELIDDKNTSEYAYLLYHLSQVYWHRNEYDQAYDIAQQSLEIAEQINDVETITLAFEMLALACHSTGDWQQGLVFEEQRSTVAGSSELDVTKAFDVHL